jgi:hypothetical protein
MNHLINKIKLQGAGGKKQKAQPAILTPPKLGKFNILSSYSVAEVIDLISDGPIEGLVDQNGKTLKKDIFKGVYLDNVPVQNTERLSEKDTSIAKINISNVLNPTVETWVADINIGSPQIKQGLWGSTLGNITKQRPSNLLFLGRQVGVRTSSTRVNFYSHMWPNFTETRQEFGAGATRFDAPPFSKEASAQNSNNFSTKIDLHYKPTTFKIGAIKNFEARAESLLSTSPSTRIRSAARKNLEKIESLKRLSSESVPIFNAKYENTFSGTYPVFLVCPINIFISELASANVAAEVSFELDDDTLENFEYSPQVLIEPEINLSSQIYTGKATGLLVIPLAAKTTTFSQDEEALYLVDKEILSLASNNISLSILLDQKVSAESNSLFNFSNLSCQFRNGEEFQKDIRGFEEVVNDFFYDTQLLGPFRKEKAIQRLLPSDFAKEINTAQYSIPNEAVIRGDEGSKDYRNGVNRNYSDWNNLNEDRNYNTVSVSHVIENPITEKITISLSVQSLSDTAETELNVGGQVGVVEAGAKLPSILHLQIETGKISNGEQLNSQVFSYIVVGLVEGGVVIDFGGKNDDKNETLKKSVKLIDFEGTALKDYLNEPFVLPALSEGEDPTTTKRYVKISKISAETNSVLINKEVSLVKVSEIIDNKLSYPFSAVAGVKMDARSFSSIPERSYDCRLKKIKIPSNYFPLNGSSSTDKRYVKQARTYDNSAHVYIGDWDGSFKEGWTDNPAWILYDLLTSKRYGLGAYIDESQVNKWELYKISKFCDAVNEEGFFIGVSDGVGGLEPRYSCNIIFREQTKVYDAINIIANLFRGVVFFSGSEIHFLDDRPRVPIALFGNSNIKDGLFNYGNTRRDQQFNTVEVVYLDRFDNYKTKVEYVQDESDIRKRGVFKTTINTMGVTSRAMARRVGQHIIYQTIKENQTISFAAGLESLLCRPGDLILVEDEMKTRSTNYGRVLQVYEDEKVIQIDGQFETQNFTGLITLYSPTGYATSNDLQILSQKNRGRVSQFEITGSLLNDSQYNILKGVYGFSGYSKGFPQIDEEDLEVGQFNLPEHLAFYTGKSTQGGHDIFCYYNTGATGFVFSTGLPFQDNNIYDKVITSTGVLFGADFSRIFVDENLTRYTGFQYDSAAPNKRSSTSGPISGAIFWNSITHPFTQGILDNEIDTYNITQLAKLSITGFDNLDYGSLIYLNAADPNVNLISFVQEGSPYRIERKNASDQIYKILSIREDNQNEYSITASKYDTGKFEEIEKFITEDFLENTFYRGPITVGNVDIRDLDSPFINQFTKINETPAGFDLSGSWLPVNGAEAYSVKVFNKLANISVDDRTEDTQFLLTGLESLGNWNLEVAALGNGSTRINSLPSRTGVFVAYQSNDPIINTLSKPAVVKFTLE